MLIDGKLISAAVRDEVAVEVNLLKKINVSPCLAVVLVGDNPASAVYVRNKKRACKLVGIESISHELPATTTEEELLQLINKLNNDKSVHGILVQSPLPDSINFDNVIEAIDPLKDVDCFHPVNVGRLLTGQLSLLPCTPAGIIELLKRSNIQISGKHCVVIGRSNIVGKPMALLMLNHNATVTICHSKTANLSEICKQADILIAAIGRPNFVTPDMLKPGVVLIDVGINRLDNGSICGDIEFDSCCNIASAITPVPGGVGPMTIAMLMKNCVYATKKQLKIENWS